METSVKGAKKSVPSKRQRLCSAPCKRPQPSVHRPAKHHRPGIIIEQSDDDDNENDGYTRFEDWLMAFENHVQLHDIRKGKLAPAVIYNMRGAAETFCYNLPLHVKENYKELTDRLVERYDGQAVCESGK